MQAEEAITKQSLSNRLAELYDVAVQDWPGEFDFYWRLAEPVAAENESVLELACGTGRIALRLASHGVRVVGLDLSTAMLDVARRKSGDTGNVRWLEGDMRDFQLDEKFALIIVPGHSFQNLVTVDAQLSCLDCARRHLRPEGKLVLHLDHQDIDWLGALTADLGGVFGPSQELVHPETGSMIQVSRAWWYRRSTQTAEMVARYEEFDHQGKLIESWESDKSYFHCFFPAEVEHLLARSGFLVQARYGDFFQGELSDESAEMIWVAGSHPSRS